MRCFSPTLLRIPARYRYHIGESLIPSVRHFLRFIGAEQKLVEHGFKYKVRRFVIGAFAMSRAHELSDASIAGCSYQVQSVQARGMYVNLHARISVHVQMCLPLVASDTDFVALGHNNSSWNVVSLWSIVLF